MQHVSGPCRPGSRGSFVIHWAAPNYLGVWRTPGGQHLEIGRLSLLMGKSDSQVASGKSWKAEMTLEGVKGLRFPANVEAQSNSIPANANSGNGN